MSVRIEHETEEQATLLYKSLWNNREKGELLHDDIEDIIEMCEDLDNQVLAMGTKHRISKILLCLTTSEKTPIRFHLIRKFFNLDTRVSMFLLQSYNDQNWRMMDEPPPG